MNKKILALTLGLMANMAPVCWAEKVQIAAEQQQVCSTNACPKEVTACPTALPDETSLQTTTDNAPEVAVPTEAEQKLTEEQLKELLDQIIAEVKKEEEEEAKKAKTSTPIVE